MHHLYRTLSHPCIVLSFLFAFVIQSLCLLSWQELELRVCGRRTIDLAVLERHTVYSPASFNRASPIIQWFWQILSEFSQEELGQFLQFVWARSRLPAEDQAGSYRIQLNILDANAKTAADGAHQAQPDAINLNDRMLPTSETCFANVSVWLYSSIDIMRAKLKMALLCSTITS